LKKHLIFIGNIFTQNRAFREYLIRSVEADGTRLSSIEYYLEADRTFFADLERMFSDDRHLYIISNKKSFTLVGKLLCTLTEDKLLLKDEMLLPSQCENFVRDSYLLNINSALVNVLQVQESREIPQLLITTAASKRTLHFFETPIKEVISLLKPLAKQYDVELLYSQIVDNWVEVEVRCKAYGSIDRFLETAAEQYSDRIIVAEELIQHIIDAILSRGQKITIAESCTGGLLASYFTERAGVSSVFEGSLVTYSNALKEQWLAVEHATLLKYGAVSEAVVSEMCEGALTVAKADYALAVSGVAGPGGGSEEKPVGTIVIGVRSKNAGEIVRCHFNGDRRYIQQQSALTALKMLVLNDKKVFFKKC